MSSQTSYYTPEFLTREYVESFLKKYFKDSTLKVEKVDIIPASVKGESYCSIMTRIEVDYEAAGGKVSNQLNLIVKSAFDNDPYLFGILQQYDVFNTEMQMYEIVFPQLQKLLYEIDDREKLCAKAIHVDRSRNAIVLEDLSVLKFTTANRLEGIDESHVQICLRKLAKVHAAAAVLNERQKGCLEKYSHGILNRHVNCYGVFFENTFRVCAKFAETCPELGIYYRDKLLKLIPYVSEYATRCYDSNPKHFLTLNHGDMWTNNFMVKYDDNKSKSNIEDILLIDFQYFNWTSPAVDLYYFFYSSLQDDLLLNHQARLIKHYHSVLTRTLEKLKYKQHIPTLHEFHVQLLERGFYDGSCKSVTLMLKTAHNTEAAKELMKNHNVFDAETIMYRAVLPEFEKLYKDAGVDVKFAPKYFEISTEHPYILLENLKTRGYENMNRLEGLDIQHTQAVLKVLAQWHAASAVRVATRGKYKMFGNFFKEENREMMKPIFDSLTDVFLKCVKAYEGHEIYYESLYRHKSAIIDEMYEANEVDESEFNVLNHGDCWSNNVMFRHDDNGDICGTYLLDYQLPHFGTPAQDLYYVLLSSTTYELKIEKFDYFIRYYYDCLKSNLTLLKYPKKIPTLRDVHIMLHKYNAWAYNASTGVMAAVLLDPSYKAKLDNYLTESDEANEFKLQLYTNPRYRKHMELVLPWLYYRGAF